MSETPSPSAARTAVVAAALELFERQGFEATSVEQIAQAAGVSRSTFFRQFGGKEDVVFADHEVLLDELREWLAQRSRRSVGGRVRGIRAGLPALRRTTPRSRAGATRSCGRCPPCASARSSRCSATSACSTSTCAASLPGLDPLDAVGFAALVTAVHNHVLRRLLRGEARAARRAARARSTTPCAATACTPTVLPRRRTTWSSRSSLARCPPPRSPAACAPDSTADARPPERASKMTETPGLDVAGLTGWLQRAHPDLAGGDARGARDRRRQEQPHLSHRRRAHPARAAASAARATCWPARTTCAASTG